MGFKVKGGSALRTMAGIRKGAFCWLISSIVFAGSFTDPIQRLSLAINDGLAALQPVPLDKRLVLVSVDDRTVKELGRFPLDRKIYARLLDVAKNHKALAVVFDILFLDRTRSDEELAKAMRRFGKAIIGCTLAAKKDRSASVPGRFSLPARGQPFIEVRGFLLPPEPLLQSAFAIGVVNILPDRDGMRRHVPVLFREEGADWGLPSLALAAAMAVFCKPIVSPGTVQWGSQRLPFGANGQFALPARLASDGSADLPTVPLIRLLTDRHAQEKVRGKILIVGATATAITDLHPTFGGKIRYGVELHALGLNGLLTGRMRREVSPLIQSVVTGLAVLTMSVWTVKDSPVGLLGSWLLFILLDLLVPTRLIRLGILFPPVPAALVATAAFIAGLVGTLWDIQRKLTRLVQQRLAPDLARAILSGSSDTVGLGERRMITVLFSDIRDFTLATGTLSPYDVQTLLNSYFTAMTELIHLYGGYLDKFIGDGLMALFGAIRGEEDHTERAVVCACHMLEESKQLELEWQRITGMPLQIGIGIHRGPAVVGDLGARDLSQFTAVGRTVNLAYRLEQWTKELKAPIVVSSEVYERVSDLVIGEAAGQVVLRGIEEQVTVYAIRSLTPEAKRLRHQFWTQARVGREG